MNTRPPAQPVKPGEGDTGRHPLLVESLRTALRQVRRLVIFLIGITVVLIGIIMFVTPGPAVLVIPIGLGILAIEFTWARLLLKRFREKAEKLGADVAGRMRKGAPK